MWCINTLEHYSAIIKMEILPFATTWIELQGIMLSKMNQTKKDKYSMMSLYMELTNREQIGGYQRQGMRNGQNE